MTTEDTLPRVLLVEDSPSTALAYQGYLAQEYRVRVAHSGAEALAALEAHSFSLLLVDVRLPDMSGLEILDRVRDQDPSTPIIMMTAHGSVDVAVEAMQRGASDFLTKPFDRARLRVTLTKALKERRLTEIVAEYEKSFEREHFHRMVGASLPMQSVYRIIESAAPSRATVFITGESGTGKELCAEAIHAQSPRADQAFVALNCAAIPRDLLESEIFGHIKGAFTGALTAREGAASRADGGTLFLDEIGELPLDLQSKLLRFIQSGSFQPVGASREQRVDVRFVCATNRDPLEEVRQGRFREDLYYRLHVIPIQMPALRERGQDVLRIARALLAACCEEEGRAFADFRPEVEALLLRHAWPGNVRELANVIRNVVVLNEGTWVEAAMLPATFDALRAGSEPDRPADEEPVPDPAPASGGASIMQGDAGEATIEPLWREEKRLIERAIALCGGNVPRAAARLEISASTIYRKKQQWEQSAV
ncbi:response regulator [Halomonas sp. D1-1]|uniref:Response regulator n=2 Tax=Halomonas icarae TaxID=2691040 RepID=A0A7X4VW46_9GAMM|nr:response regulator [Halomonas icarae]